MIPIYKRLLLFFAITWFQSVLPMASKSHGSVKHHDATQEKWRVKVSPKTRFKAASNGCPRDCR
jgi:hypothetical protein